MSTSERQRRAAVARTQRALRWIIWPSYALILGGGIAFLGTGISQRPDLTVLFHGFGLAVIAIAHWLTEKAKTAIASDLLIGLFFIIYFAAAAFSGGTTSPYMGGFLLVVVGGGVLRGGRTGLIAAVASIAAAMLFAVADEKGLLPASLMPMTPLFNFVAWTLIFGMTGVLLHLTLGELQRALGRAEETEVALESTLSDLHRTSVSKASVENVLLGLGDAVIVLDPEEVVREVNPRAVQIFGMEEADLLGTPFRKLLAKGHNDASEAVLRTATGPRRVSISWAPIHGAGGQIDGFAIVAHDLEAHIAAEDKLRAAVEEAERASTSKSHFLATMSHELRTPLNAIIGYAEFVQEELEDDLLISDVARIERSGRDLLALINDVLDLSKIEAGRVELESRPVDLPELVDDVGQQVAPLVAKNDNRFRLQLDPYFVENPELVTDPTRVRQILRNLLSNAAKFTENGVVTLSIQLLADEQSVSIAVTDTGVGMTPTQLERVWSPFTQAEASTTRQYGGTGLGLPITRHLCGLLGGRIDATSTPGEGTCFTAVLPLHGAADATVRPEPPQPDSPGAGAVDGGTRHEPAEQRA